MCSSMIIDRVQIWPTVDYLFQQWLEMWKWTSKHMINGFDYMLVNNCYSNKS
jgi:hypothetical protein